MAFLLYMPFTGQLVQPFRRYCIYFFVHFLLNGFIDFRNNDGYVNFTLGATYIMSFPPILMDI